MTAKTTAKTRAAYAEYCPYGLRTVSWGDCVIRFASVEERDAFVEDANRDRVARGDFGIARAVTRDEARKTYRVETITDACTRETLDQLDSNLSGYSVDTIMDDGLRTACAYRRREPACGRW